MAEAVVAGITAGCREAGCALIGGETAEMPGMYAEGHYDLAGFCVGAVNRDAVLPRTEAMRGGDVLIGLPSSGAHANGFSLIRKVVAEAGLGWDAPCPFGEGTIGEAFLVPTRLYVLDLLPIVRAGKVKGLAHVTGGGLTENVPRALPGMLRPAYDDAALALPPLFAWLKEAGGLTDVEMRRTFNAGIGMVAVCGPEEAGEVLSACEGARAIGELRPA